MMKANHSQFLDRLGASLSVACALHCVLQPVLLLFLPILGLGFFLNEQAESIFLLASVLLASFSIIQGYRHHGHNGAFPLLFLAVALISLSRLPAAEAWEMPLAVTGALSIAGAHLFNSHLHRRFHTPQKSEPLSEPLTEVTPISEHSESFIPEAIVV